MLPKGTPEKDPFLQNHPRRVLYWELELLTRSSSHDSVNPDEEKVRRLAESRQQSLKTTVGRR